MGIAAAVALIASNVFAQPGGGGGFGGGRGGAVDPTTLLGQEPIQKELELSADQKEKVTALADSVREARQAMFQGGGGAGGGDFQEMQKKMTEMTEANKKKVAEILQPPQNARRDEIMLQLSVSQSPATALTQGNTGEKLGLTEDQKKKVADLVAKNQEKTQSLFQDAGGDFQGMQEKMTKLRDDLKNDAMAVLTPEQKEKLTKLQGKTFDVSTIQMGRGGRGGGFGGGGGGIGGRF